MLRGRAHRCRVSSQCACACSEILGKAGNPRRGCSNGIVDGIDGGEGFALFWRTHHAVGWPRWTSRSARTSSANDDGILPPGTRLYIRHSGDVSSLRLAVPSLGQHLDRHLNELSLIGLAPPHLPARASLKTPITLFFENNSTIIKLSKK